MCSVAPFVGIMATFLEFNLYGTDVATNGTSYNDSYAPILCLVNPSTVTYSTSSTPSSRPPT
jgi:hypothetical protein